MPKKVIIFGSTTLAKLALFYSKNDPDINVIGFVVDTEFKLSEQFLSLPLYTWPNFKNEFSNRDTLVFMAVGYKEMSVREKIFGKIKDAGYEMINIISESSYIADNVKLRENNFIMPGVVLEPGLVIGDNNIIWSNATICHDSKIGSHNFIAANVTIGGEVTIGDNNFFGFSSTVLQHRKIGDETLIGAHSMVLSDTLNQSAYYGVPAKKVSSIEKNEGIKIR